MNWRPTLVKFVVIFLLPCTVITIGLIFTIGNVQSFRIGPFQLLDDHYTLHATFDDVSGLLINDNVKIAGVVVGKVTRVRVEDGRAHVRLNVRDDIRLPRDSEATVRWRNLLGSRYLYLHPGEASTVLQGGDSIERTRSVVDLGELFNRLGPIVQALDPAQVNEFLDAVVSALDGNEDKIRQALVNLAVVADMLGARDQAIGRLVENLDVVAGTIADRDREIRLILDNLVAIVTTFSENTDVLDAAVTELSEFSDHLGTLLQDNRSEIDNTIANLATVVEVVRQKLPTVDNLVGNLDDAALRLFSASRHGEWLNQDILCGTIGVPPASVEVPCLVTPGLPEGPPLSNPVFSNGSTAVMELIGGLTR